MLLEKIAKEMACKWRVRRRTKWGRMLGHLDYKQNTFNFQGKGILNELRVVEVYYSQKLWWVSLLACETWPINVND